MSEHSPVSFFFSFVGRYELEDDGFFKYPFAIPDCDVLGVWISVHWTEGAEGWKGLMGLM